MINNNGEPGSACPVCGILKVEKGFKPKVGKVLSADDTKSLICQYASKAGCLNTVGTITPDSDSWEKRSSL